MKFHNSNQIMQANLRFNPDKSLCEVQYGGEEDVWGPLDATEAGHVLVDEETGEAYYLALTDDEGLTAETLYKLEPLEVEVEDGVDIGAEEEEGEEEDGGEEVMA